MWKNCGTYTFKTKGTKTFKCRVSSKGSIKSVRVHQQSTECLNLLEVEIHGIESNRLEPTGSAMDSVYYDQVSGNCFDGKKSGKMCHSKCGKSRHWLRADFANVEALSHVTITNRPGQEGRLGTFDLEYALESAPSVWKNCGTYTFTTKGTRSFDCNAVAPEAPNDKFCDATIGNYNCQAKRGFGAHCWSPKYCKSGLCKLYFCIECEHDSECGTGEFCDNKCKPKLGYGSVCLRDGVCASGMCLAGKCIDCGRPVRSGSSPYPFGSSDLKKADQQCRDADGNSLETRTNEVGKKGTGMKILGTSDTTFCDNSLGNYMCRRKLGANAVCGPLRPSVTVSDEVAGRYCASGFCGIAGAPVLLQGVGTCQICKNSKTGHGGCCPGKSNDQCQQFCNLGTCRTRLKYRAPTTLGDYSCRSNRQTSGFCVECNTHGIQGQKQCAALEKTKTLPYSFVEQKALGGVNKILYTKAQGGSTIRQAKRSEFFLAEEKTCADIRPGALPIKSMSLCAIAASTLGIKGTPQHLRGGIPPGCACAKRRCSDQYTER